MALGSPAVGVNFPRAAIPTPLNDFAESQNSQPPARRPVAADHPALAPEILRRLYIEEGLSLKQVADRIGPPASKRIVQRALQRDGVPLRPAIPPARKQALMSKEQLERLYIDEGRSLPEVAAIFGVTPSTVIKRMRSFNLDRRKGAWRGVGDRQPLSHDLLWELRVVQRLSAHRIGETLGYSEIQVRSALKRHGIFLPGYNNSLVNELDAGELWWLHHHEYLPITTIARKLRASPSNVIRRMEELGVEQRGPGKRPLAVDRPAGLPAPDLDLIEAVLQKAASKPPSVQRTGRIAQASDEELRRLHLEQKKGLTEIGVLYGCAPETVRRRLQSAGIDVRHRRGRQGTGPPTIESLEKLSALYARADVIEALARLGIPVRQDDEPIEPTIDLTRNIVEDLYLRLGLTLDEVGLLTGRSHSAVGRSIRHNGLNPRKHLPEPALPVTLSDDLLNYDKLIELASSGMGADAIARRLGLTSPTPVRVAAQVLEIVLPGEPGPPPIPEAVMYEVRSSGISAPHVGRVLEHRHLGTGAGTGLPAWPWPPGQALVEYLYRTLGLGVVECADRLRCKVDDLKDLIVGYGMPLRDTDEFRDSDRWRLDPQELRSMYLDQGMRVDDIAAILGSSNILVYRAMHRYHLPVARYTGQEPRVRYDDLMADSRVAEALAAAGIEPPGVDPPLRRRPLQPELLRVLVGELGLSSLDVELLTGRDAVMVRADCAHSGIKKPQLPAGVTEEILRELYETKGWPMARIAQELGLRGEGALRTLLRRAGIPKRSFKANPWDTRRKKAETGSTEPRL